MAGSQLLMNVRNGLEIMGLLVKFEAHQRKLGAIEEARASVLGLDEERSQMDTTDILASTLLITFGLPSLYFNMLLVLPAFGTTKPFELICGCHAVGNLIATAAIVSSTSMIFFKWDSNIFSRLSGSAIRYAFFLLHYTNITLAINRFMAIYCAKHYNIIFSTSSTKKTLVIIMVCNSAWFFVALFEECAFYFIRERIQFSFEMNQCAVILSKYFDFYVTVLLFAANSVLDLLTALGIYRYSKANALSARRLSRSDVIFFFQCCASNAAVIGCFLLVYHFKGVYQDRLGAFLTSTFIMQLTHFIDGVAVVLLNRNVRAHIFEPYKLLHLKSSSVHNRMSTSPN